MLTFNNHKYQTGNGINPVHSGISFKGQQKNDLSSWLAETPIAVRFPDLNNAGRTSAEDHRVTHRGRRNFTNRLRFIYWASSILHLWQNSQFLLFWEILIMLDSQTKLLLFNITNRTSASSKHSPNSLCRIKPQPKQINEGGYLQIKQKTRPWSDSLTSWQFAI